METEHTAALHAFLATRGILPATAQHFGISYMVHGNAGYCGIPIKDDDGKVVCTKMRALQSKEFRVEPSGAGHQLFGRGVLQVSGLKHVVICEGEFDCLLLLQADIAAVTSTAGAQTFDEEWLDLFPKDIEVTLCFDNDKAGEQGREKVQKLFTQFRPDVKLFDIRFNDEGMKLGYDVTDWYVERVVKAVDPTVSASEAEKEFARMAGEATAELLQRRVKWVPKGTRPGQPGYERPVLQLGAPLNVVEYDEWVGFVADRLENVVYAAEVCMATVCQLLIHDVMNCCALVLIDEASSGKTVCLNLFCGMKELTETTDDFTPAAFVSGMAGKSERQLQKIDLLPRLKGRAFVVREMAPIFAEKEEDLLKRIGLLTRVLDGEGYEVDTGVHGKRGYQGDYVFMMLAASKPIALRVWKVMREYGYRLFFLNMRSPRDEISALAGILQGVGFKEKEVACQLKTSELLRSIWAKNPKGVHWERAKDDQDSILMLARLADFVSRFRGEIVVYEAGRDEDGNSLLHTQPSIEFAKRLVIQLYNLARGSAVAHGRNYITRSDLKPAVRVAMDTAPDPRPDILRLLMKKGKLRTPDIEQGIGVSAPKARKEMEKLIQLGVCRESSGDEKRNAAWLKSQDEFDLDRNQGGAKEIMLDKGYEWLRSEEFIKLIDEFAS